MAFQPAKFFQGFLPPTSLSRTIFLTLFLIGIFLRVAGLTWGIPHSGNQSSVYHDEGHVLSFVLKGHEDFKKDFGEYEIVRPVYLYRLLGRPLIALGDHFGLNDGANRVYELSALRSITAAFGIAGLLAIYALGKQVATYRTGLWAMAALTFMPAHWYYSQILKGDLIVATLFTLSLICAIHMARTGNRWAYVLGAIILGAGTSFKATAFMVAPVFLLAHLLFAWQQKRLSTLLSGRALLFLLVAVGSFAVLYPYPFYNFDQYWNFIENPALQHLSPRFLVSPATYLATVKQYHSPTRPFFEMIFGKFLLWAFIPSLIVVTGAMFYRSTQKRRRDLALILALFVLFFHSLTFSDALDERYILPFAPFAALFPALVITGFGLHQSRSLRTFSSLVGLALVASTAAITTVLFPSFALADPRRQAVEWVEAAAPAGSVIAQATQTSRWALVFDSMKNHTASFLYGEEGDRHVTVLSTPDYVAVQQEPWNYDHTFRYELAGIDLENELTPFLGRFQEKHTFGKIPQLLGFRIPQTLGSPVIHVYSSPSEAPAGREAPFPLPSLASSRPIQSGAYLTVADSRRITAAPNSYLRFTVRTATHLSEEAEGEIYLGVSLQPAFSAPSLSERLEDPEVVQAADGPVLFYRLPASALREDPDISLTVHFPEEGKAVFYREDKGKVSHVGQGKTAETFGIHVFSLVPEDVTLPGTFTVEEAVLGDLTP